MKTPPWLSRPASRPVLLRGTKDLPQWAREELARHRWQESQILAVLSATGGCVLGGPNDPCAEALSKIRAILGVD